MAAPSAPAVASDAASRVATDKRINAGAQMTTMRSGALRVTMLRQPYQWQGCRYLGLPRARRASQTPLPARLLTRSSCPIVYTRLSTPSASLCHRRFRLPGLYRETNLLPAMTYRRHSAVALVIPIRGVTQSSFARKPSLPSHKLERGEVRSHPLSRARVIPNASARRPGPLVSFGRSAGACTTNPRARAISSMPASGSRARNKTEPAFPSRSHDTFRQ
jgi:hypothetical protein